MREKLIAAVRFRIYGEIPGILEEYDGSFDAEPRKSRSILAIYLDPMGTLDDGMAWPSSDLPKFKEHLQLLLRKGARLTSVEEVKVNKAFTQRLIGVKRDIQKLLFIYGIISQVDAELFSNYGVAIDELTQSHRSAALSKNSVIAYLNTALSRALKPKSGGQDEGVLPLTLKAVQDNDLELQGFLAQGQLVDYSRNVTYKKGKRDISMPWIVYCLMEAPETLGQKSKTSKALFYFILARLKDKINQSITYLDQTLHPLLWVIKKGSPFFLDIFLDFAKKNGINLAYPVYGFNLNKREFGRLEEFLEQHNIPAEMDSVLKKHFLGDDEAGDFYEVEETSKKAKQNDEVPMAIDDEVVPRAQAAAVSGAKTGHKKSGQGGSRWVVRQDSKGIAVSGEATQHYRRRQKDNLADFIVYDSEEEASDIEEEEVIVSDNELSMAVDVPVQEIGHYDADSEDDDTEFSYSGIELNAEFQQPEKRFVVHARGIHFYREDESAEESRTALLEQPFDALHSPAVRSYQVTPEYPMSNIIRYVNKQYAKLSQECEPFQDGYGHEFRSRKPFHQQVYSNSGEKYKGIIVDVAKRGELFNGMNLSDHPFVSTSRKFSEAARYGLGDKFGSLGLKEKRLRPCYDVNGKPEHPYVGMLYVVIHGAEVLQQAQHNTVINLYARGEAHIDHRIVGEEEVSFVASVPQKHVFCKVALKFPSFVQEWSETFKDKYGINHAEYQRFKAMFKNPEQQQQAIQEITGKLIRRLEQKITRLVRDKMDNRNQVYESLEDGFVDRAPALPVARLMRLYHLVVKERPDACQRLADVGLPYLQGYIQSWERDEIKNPYLLKLINQIVQWKKSNSQQYFDEIAIYSIRDSVNKIIAFVGADLAEIQRVVQLSMRTRFKSEYGEDLAWFEMLLQCNEDQLVDAIKHLTVQQLSLLKKFRQFKDLEVSPVSRLAILFKAYQAKERDIIAALPQDAIVARGRATVAAASTVTLRPVAAEAAIVPVVRVSAADVSPESMSAVLDPENLFLAIQLGDKEFVEKYLEKTQEEVVSIAGERLPDETIAIFNKRRWQQYEAFFIKDKAAGERDCYQSALHYAAGYPHGVARPDIFSILRKRVFEHHLSVICKMPGTKDSSLHLAARSGSVETVRLIMRSNANLNPDCVNEEGDTPLHAACRAGHLAVVKLLAEYGNTSPKNSKNNKTPCQLAAEAGHQEIVNFLSLFDELMQALNACFADSTRRLIHNIEQVHLDVLQAVLQRCIAYPSVEVKRLVQLKCESAKSKPRYFSSIDYGKTIAYLACADGNERLVSLLCRLNVNVNVMPVRYESSKKLYPAFIKAALSDQADVVITLLKHDPRYLYTTVKDIGLVVVNKQKYGADIFEEKIQSKLSKSMQRLLTRNHREFLRSGRLKECGFSDEHIATLSCKIRPAKRPSGSEETSPPKSRRESLSDQFGSFWRSRGAAAADEQPELEVELESVCSDTGSPELN